MVKKISESQNRPANEQNFQTHDCLHPSSIYLKSKGGNPKQDPLASDCFHKALFCHLPEDVTQSWRFPCLFGTILENSRDIINVKDRNSKYLLINKTGAEIFGKLPREVVGKDPTFFFPPDLARKIMEDDQRILGKGRTETFENSLLSATGELRTFLSTKGPIFDEKGYVIGLFTISKDITVQKEIKERLELALEAGKMGICDWVIGRRKTYWSAEQKRLFGLKGDSESISVGKMFSLIHPDDRSEVAEKTSRAESHGESFQTQFRVAKPDGSISWIEQFSKVVSDLDGEPRRRVSVNLDITKRKDTELALQQAKKAAENANELKSQFLAHMSHEIRSPLTVVMGMLDLVLDTSLSPEQSYCLQQVKTATGLLAYVIDDILDFSMIEAKKLALQSHPFVLEGLVRGVIELISLKAKEKGLGLDFRIAPDLPEWVVGDEYRLRQVLLNLLGNAIKFTDRGNVSLDVDFEHQEGRAQTHFLRFSVKDTGVGIPSNQKNLLFKPFQQTDNNFFRKQGGTGLGLTICKEIVSLFGGDIQVESEPGKGSVFSFTAYFEKSQGPPSVSNKVLEKSVLPTKSEARKVLIVDDDPLLRQLIYLVLQKDNHQIVLAGNGFEALEKCKSDQFDLIIMDMQMPEMDGLETTRRIRKRESKQGDQHTPIIALTAHAMKEYESLCLEAGMNDYISKPIEIPRFLEKVSEHLK